MQMGLIYAEIELMNAIDLAMTKRYQIGEEEIKRIHVITLIDAIGNTW